ncbi:creatininase family protein [Paenibacillus sp. GCM10023252]|uniref:creatininase family protein n=1 Tax=Paenibacillus sp. GCM10023252 TaxID=3252649 RepID=UPI0036239397
MNFRWLYENVGDTDPLMTSLPPELMYKTFLYQLRAFYNTGFRGIIALSGHGGAHTQDFKRIAGNFAQATGCRVWYGTDFELAGPSFPADHAGRYELSTLMHLRPELVDLQLQSLERQLASGGRLAIHSSAHEATAAYGRAIVEACEAAMVKLVRQLAEELQSVNAEQCAPLDYQAMEAMWTELLQQQWISCSPRAGQEEVPSHSRWKPYERTTAAR